MANELDTLLNRAQALLKNRDKIQAELTIAESKLVEVQDELNNIEGAILKKFGTTDIAQLQVKLQELMEQAEQSLKEIEQTK